MLEKDLLQWIISVAEATGWKVWHVPVGMVADKRTGAWRPFARAAGLPDLFMLHTDPDRMIIAEVKGTGGKVSDKQREFLQAASRVASCAMDMNTAQTWHATEALNPLGVYVWTPADQTLIEHILTSKVLI